MAFKFHQLSSLVQRDPQAAYARLRVLFSEHAGNVSQLASSQGVDRSTVFRWLRALGKAGFGDPRGGQRGTTGPKPRPKRLPETDGQALAGEANGAQEA